MTMAARSALEARFKIERELLTRDAPCIRVRVFPFPHSDRRHVILCAELSDGTDVQCVCPLDFAIDPNDFNEARVAFAFAELNQTRH